MAADQGRLRSWLHALVAHRHGSEVYQTSTLAELTTALAGLRLDEEVRARVAEQRAALSTIDDAARGTRRPTTG